MERGKIIKEYEALQLEEAHVTPGECPGTKVTPTTISSKVWSDKSQKESWLLCENRFYTTVGGVALESIFRLV